MNSIVKNTKKVIALRYGSFLTGNEGQKLYSIQNLLNQMITDIQYLASGKVTGNIGAEVAKLPTTSIRMAIAFIAMLPLFIIYPFLQK